MPVIHSDQNFLLFAIIAGTVAVSVFLESKYKWAGRMSALVIILLLAIVFSNIHLIPTEAPVYDFVWDYCLPFSLPLLLYQSNLRKICRESGQLLAAFLIGAAGTVAGAFAAYGMFQNHIDELPGLSAMMTGTYIGGSVNFAILGSAFHVSGSSISAATIADNLNMAIYFLILFAIPVQKTCEKMLSSKEVLTGKKEVPAGKKEALTGKTLSVGLGLSAGIVAVAQLLSDTFAKVIPTSGNLSMAANSLLGNRYMWITTCTVLIATFVPHKMEKLTGLQEIGTFLIYCFIFVIGVPASISEIIKKSPLLLLFALVIVASNMLFTFGFGTLLRIDRKTLILASNANVGGPTTAASMAIAKGWDAFVGPSILVGCLGYVLGNYLGLIVGNVLS